MHVLCTYVLLLDTPSLCLFVYSFMVDSACSPFMYHTRHLLCFLFGLFHLIQPPTHPLLITKPHVQFHTFLIMRHYRSYTARVCYIRNLSQTAVNCSDTVLHALTKAYVAETSCNQLLLINSAMYMLIMFHSVRKRSSRRGIWNAKCIVIGFHLAPMLSSMVACLKVFIASDK